MAENTKENWIGFDLGGTKMLAAVLNEKAKVLGRHRKKTKGHEGWEEGLGRMVATIRKAVEESEIDPNTIGGIGVGCAGPIDLDKGVIFEAPNLGWEKVPVKKTLEEELGWPVEVVNDVDAGVFGEYSFGAANGARCVVGIFPGTGIGGGCVYEGQIIRGKVGSCMEIGHIQVIPEGIASGHSLSGSLEAVASRLAISAQAAQAAYRGAAPNLRKIAGTDISDIRSGALADSIKAGDKVIEQIVCAAADKIGVAVATIVHLLAPDIVVLGGGLVEAMPELIVEEVQKSAKRRVLPSFSKTYSVVAAKLGDDATVMGAAAWARSRLSNPEK